ncbi:MAG: hypothetical protein L0387_34170 [Acidobacteria bacterium]|nr:hypothetical protein [Acidobacteriota bacterium]MCI0724044.1 hypothetical protein [Acidobacteriota bacterium]
MKKRAYIAISTVPLVAFLAFSHYVNSLEPFSALFAAPLLFLPLILSLAIGCAGIVLVIQAARRREKLLALTLATLLASSVNLWFLGGFWIQAIKETL